MLSQQLRDELIAELKDWRRDGFFGDGLEEEYIMDGCIIIGLNQMSDRELIDELSDTFGDDDLIARCEACMAEHEMLAQKCMTVECE